MDLKKTEKRKNWVRENCYNKSLNSAEKQKCIVFVYFCLGCSECYVRVYNLNSIVPKSQTWEQKSLWLCNSSISDLKIVKIHTLQIWNIFWNLTNPHYAKPPYTRTKSLSFVNETMSTQFSRHFLSLIAKENRNSLKPNRKD